MRPFVYETVFTPTDAVVSASAASRPSQADRTVSFLAGGTTLVDLMKLDVMRPTHLIDINPLAKDPNTSRIQVSGHGLRIGALVRMSEAAAHPTVLRDYPVIADSLALAASSGLRNMASLGGNMLQRTRCSATSATHPTTQCNKRVPGLAVAPRSTAFNRGACRAGRRATTGASPSYPGDFAQALMVLRRRASRCTAPEVLGRCASARPSPPQAGCHAGHRDHVASRVS